MKLPEKIELRVTMHGHGGRGMAFYGYADNAGLGVHMTARRETRHLPFVESWQFAWLPEQEFANYKALRDAVEVLPDEAIAAQKAKYPCVSPLKPIGDRKYENKCRLCPWGPDRKVGKFSYGVYRSPLDFDIGELCDEHAPIAANAVELLAALDTEIAAHKALRSELPS